MSKCYWRNGSERLVRHRIAAKLRFINSVVSAKHHELNCRKTQFPVLYCHNSDEACPGSVALMTVLSTQNRKFQLLKYFIHSHFEKKRLISQINSLFKKKHSHHFFFFPKIEHAIVSY